VNRSFLPALPAEWAVSPLKHACHLNPEVLLESTPGDTELDYVDIAALESGTGRLVPKALKFDSAPSRARRVLRSGDTILSTVRTYLKAVASFPRVDSNLVASTGFAVVRPNGRLYPRFAYWALLSEPFIESVVAHSEGVSYPAINPSVLGSLSIVLPPATTQVQIANFLDEQTARIDALIEEKEQLVKELRTYQYSQASHLMTRGLKGGVPLQTSSYSEIGQVPAHWKVTPLKFLGEVRSGVAKGKDLGGKDKVVLPYLRVANVQDGYVDLTEVSDIEIAASDATRYLLQKGDVLMNEGGDNDKLGRGAVWQGQIDPCIHQNHVFAVRLTAPALSDWVSRFTSTHAARTYFFLRSKQSTNLASINQSNVRELPVPMPPEVERLEIQAELERMSKATNDLIGHAIEHTSLLREYRLSLISAAVTGQLDINCYKEAA